MHDHKEKTFNLKGTVQFDLQVYTLAPNDIVFYRTADKQKSFLWLQARIYPGYPYIKRSFNIPLGWRATWEAARGGLERFMFF